MVEDTQPHPTLAPLITLFVLSICLCIYSFGSGAVCARVWFYKGALGPDPKKFFIIPRHWRHKTRPKQPAERNTATGITSAMKVRRVVQSLSIYHEDLPNHNRTTSAMRTQSRIFGNDLAPPPNIHAFLNECNRISRINTFEQDDCGDGSHFPDIDFTNEPIEQADELHQRHEYSSFGLTKIDGTKWLSIEPESNEQASCRARLLDEQRRACVWILPAAEDACEEALQEVSTLLINVYPTLYEIRSRFNHKNIVCKASKKEYALDVPFDFHPLETCARLAGCDISVFERNDFTQGWYITASVTAFPSGWRLEKHIGRSVDAIIDDVDEPIIMWEAIPSILDLALSTPSTPLTRHTTFIQTHASSLSSALHIHRPADLFAGTTESLKFALHVRRETQTFRVLPKSKAVVMATKTELRPLTELGAEEKSKLMMEIEEWGDEEALLKGKDLWIPAVSGWCSGGEMENDDMSIIIGMKNPK